MSICFFVVLSVSYSFLLDDRFLRLLASYDWAFSPLVVDINNDMTSEDAKEISVSLITFHHFQLY